VGSRRQLKRRFIMDVATYANCTIEMVVCERKRELVRINSPRDVYVALKRFHGKKQETFIVLTLDCAHQVSGIRIVSIGLVNKTVVHPREVFGYAIRDNAVGIIISHNHPSGRLDPSPEDIEITQRLKNAGDIMGIALLDHVVFAKSGYFSFIEHGLLDPHSDN
jgi:DNA repair protein RadC